MGAGWCLVCTVATRQSVPRYADMGVALYLIYNWVLILEQILNLFNLITHIWAHSSSLLEQNHNQRYLPF